ncbi:EAL domain-containing protein [Cellulomonas timonensis]|uniref:EAL domain-containing protein n=1 Tax=Cellulomonas timonensis TaxID=1689271 RepID=UPI000A3DF96A|nr:EAL domain-containing protein [Cellulomonas timonensis]
MAPPSTVLVLTPWTAGSYHGSIIAGVTRDAAAHDDRLIVVQTLDAGSITETSVDPPPFHSHVGMDAARGVIAVSTATRRSHMEAVLATGTPLVIASNRFAGLDAPVAMPANEGGIAAAVEHLIEHGHTRIGFGGNLGQSDIRERYAAYHDTLLAHGITPEPSHYYPASDNVELGGAEIAHALVRQKPADRPTAMIVATDRNAMGLLPLLPPAGIAVPSDLAVIGFDNAAGSAYTTPPLSSVNQRFDRLGMRASALLRSLLAGESTEVESTEPARLALRSSCGCEPLLTEGVHDASAADIEGALLERIEAALCDRFVVPPDEQAVPTAHQALVDYAHDIVATRREPAAEDLQRMLEPLIQHVTVPEVLQNIDTAVSQFVRELATSIDADPALEALLVSVGARASVVLWHRQSGLYLDRSHDLQDSLHEQYGVGVELLGHGTSDPRRLNWLAGSHLRAGILGTWRDRETMDELVIEGVHDPHGLLGDLQGRVVPVGAFPPPEFVAASDPSASLVVFVVPVRTADDDWGWFAVIGPVDTVSERQTYNHWAALLCAAFSQESLAETVRSGEERYGLLARAMNEGLWEWRTGGGITMTGRCRSLLGLSPDDELDWRAGVHDGDIADLTREVQSVVNGHKSLAEVELRYQGPHEDEYRWLLVRTMPLSDRSLGSQRLLGSVSDIDHRKRLEEKLRRNALYDAATGLPNRRLFLERLERSVARWQETRTPFAVVFLDLDRFKVVNDSLGHQAGDRLLQVVSDRLRTVLRGQDTAARFGGDEFAVLLDGANPDTVPTIVRRIQDSLARPVEIEGHALWVTASLGIASSAVDYHNADDVLRDADTAMYHAKSHEPGTQSYFDETMHAEALHHVRLQGAVQDGLDLGQFEVYYQPIVLLDEGPLERFEALVRWNHPERGVLLPGEFLPLMEETGLVVRLGRQVIEDVCKQLAAWRTSYDRPVNVSVNLSDREFWHAGLVDHVRSNLAKHGLDASCLTLEVTEGVIMRRPELAQQLMSRMRAAGLRLHIDDFGAGHSSLQTLHRYPVEALKIDRSFVQELAAGGQNRELVRAIVAMGTALGLEVIAEGIETPEQLAVLREVGCGVGQGFLFDRAVPGDRAAELLGHSFEALACVLPATSPAMSPAELPGA